MGAPRPEHIGTRATDLRGIELMRESLLGPVTVPQADLAPRPLVAEASWRQEIARLG